MDTLLRDVRFAFRQLRRNPAFTLVACVTIGLGVGATSAIFSVVNAVLLRSLDLEAPDRLVRIYHEGTVTGEAQPQVSYPTLTDIRNQSRSLAASGGFRYWVPTVSGRDLPESFLGVYLTEGLPATLGIAPARGRWFDAGADTPGKVSEVVLSDAVWRSRFGADPGVLGRRVMIEGKPTTVVGVLPPGFRFPDLVPDNVSIPSREPDLYLPVGQGPDDLASRGSSNFWMVSRLAPGVSLAAARAELGDIAERLGERFPDDYRGQTLALRPLQQDIVGAARPPLLVLMGAVGLVLLIACSNVSALLLARAETRGREFALRTALGAAPGGLVRQLMTEALVLGLMGGALGALIGSGGVDLIRAVAPNTIPRIGEVSVDGRILLFTLVVAVGSGVLFGLSPALAGRRQAPVAVLRDGARGSGRRSRLRSALVVFEVALSVVLLTGAGLLLRSFARILETDPGFDGRNVLTLLTVLPPTRYSEEASQRAYLTRALARIRELPGVVAAGAVNTVPLSNLGGSTSISLPGQPEEPSQTTIAYRTVAGSYFEAFKLPLRAGRPLVDGDSAGTPPVALLSESAARQFFGGVDPVGRQVRLGNDAGPRTVVGVVGDVRDVALDQAPPSMVYYPYSQRPEAIFTLVVRTAQDPRLSATAIRRELASLDPDLAVFITRTMDDLTAGTLQRRRFILMLLGGFAVAAVVMAAIGLYGLVGYMVVQRTREIGIRVALGAGPAAVQRLLYREGGGLALGGVALGLLGSLLATRLLQSQLVGISPLDPVAIAGTAVVLLLVCLLATAIPARRVTRLDPLAALRDG